MTKLAWTMAALTLTGHAALGDPPPKAQSRSVPKPGLSAIVTPTPTKIAIQLGNKPDLVVCKFEPARLTGANRHLLRFRVYNIGTAPAPYHLLWVDFGGFKNKLPVPPLKPGAYNQWIYNQADVGCCNMMYTFFVDRDAWVTESNENNNVLDGAVSESASEPVPKCSDGKMH